TLVFTSAFNLNWNHAPVFSDSSKGSYFGYSVAFLKDNYDYTLLIGAPKGVPNNGDPVFNTQLNLESPGVVHQCRLKNNWECTFLKIETHGNREDGAYRDSVYHNKNRSMFGGALAVNDDDKKTVLRHLKRLSCMRPSCHEKGHYLMNGICYFHKDPSKRGLTTKNLMPLINTHYQSGEDTYTHEVIFNYAYGEAGFTVHFPKNSNDLILGAPGVFDWK
ncbi:hypothetical protein L9F63_023002, partial [Diploptera punctata]